MIYVMIGDATLSAWVLSGRKRKTGTMITILADDRRHNNFHRLIEKTTNGLFGLMKLTTNGSDANLYAVTSMTKGNNSGCLIGCGSYVSGDSGPLQSWSTSDFEIGSGLYSNLFILNIQILLQMIRKNSKII